MRASKRSAGLLRKRRPRPSCVTAANRVAMPNVFDSVALWFVRRWRDK